MKFILSILFAVTGAVTYCLFLLVYRKEQDLLINRIIKISKHFKVRIINVEGKDVPNLYFDEEYIDHIIGSWTYVN